MLIVENSIIELLDIDLNPISLLRVLWISPDGKETYVMDITDKKKMDFPFYKKYEDLEKEIKEGKAHVISIEPDLNLISPTEEFLKKFGQRRDQRWEAIKDIVGKEPEIYIDIYRGKMVKEAEGRTGKRKNKIYNYLKRYWFYGKVINGLLDDYLTCGRPGEKRNYTKKPGPKSTYGNTFIVQEQDKVIFKSAINVLHKRQRLSLKRTHEKMCETHYKRGYYRKYGVKVPIVHPEKNPTYRQFMYWYHNEYSPLERQVNKRGKRKATMTFRPLQDRDLDDIDCVGAYFEIDSTPADIILVSFDRKTEIGKPTLYFVIDVFSRLIAGFHVCLTPPSWTEAMVAFENATTDKVELCSKYGIQIQEKDWPCRYLPKYLVGDRGELKGKKAEQLIALGVRVRNAPSYRGDLKPFVEQQFRLLNATIRDMLEGSTPAEPIVRGDHDPSRDAIYTVEEFTKWVIIYILTYNKSALSKEYIATPEMFQDRVELTPIDVWNWKAGKKLLHEKPRNVIRENLLPKEKAKVSRWGIEFRDLCYTSEVGLKDGWFEREEIDGRKEVDVTFDPRNCSSIFLRLKDGSFIQCYLVARFKQFAGLHFEEVKLIMNYKNEQISKKEREEKQHLAELSAFSSELTKNAKVMTKEAQSDISFYQTQQNKREVRKSDGRAFSSKHAWSANSKKNETSMITENQIISFPNRSEPETESKQSSSNIQQLYESKIKGGRRRNHEISES